MSAQTRRRASSSKGAPAAALLGGPKPATVIEGTTVQATEPFPTKAPPVFESEEHAAKQAEYRRHIEFVREQERLAREEAAAAPPPPPAPAGPSREEVALREHQEALGQYLTDVAAMDPSERRYVATGRAPRPRYAGLQLEPGDVIPGAALWPRVDSWVRSGLVREE